MNANDQLKEYTSTDSYYKYNFGLLITDGAKALADKFECYWFLDIIASYQGEFKQHEFQVWSLGRNEDCSAIVIFTDGNNTIIVSQNIPWTDFKPTVATVFVENGSALLPSEH